MARLMKGWEVEWCSHVPVIDGDAQLDDAVMHFKDFPIEQKDKAVEFAKKKLEIDWFGSVRITEFYMEPFEPGYPGLTREYSGQPEYIDS